MKNHLYIRIEITDKIIVRFSQGHGNYSTKLKMDEGKVFRIKHDPISLSETKSHKIIAGM